ncbi:hypothetical protein Mapa_013963 [Marchantia paleacea]|nr:hypothetical protein Mapa_013963 [Marchantia paleacea]
MISVVFGRPFPRSSNQRNSIFSPEHSIFTKCGHGFGIEHMLLLENPGSKVVARIVCQNWHDSLSQNGPTVILLIDKMNRGTGKSSTGLDHSFVHFHPEVALASKGRKQRGVDVEDRPRVCSHQLLRYELQVPCQQHIIHLQLPHSFHEIGGRESFGSMLLGLRESQHWNVVLPGVIASLARGFVGHNHDEIPVNGIAERRGVESSEIGAPAREEDGQFQSHKSFIPILLLHCFRFHASTTAPRRWQLLP